MSKNVSIVSYIPENRIALMRQIRMFYPNKTIFEVRHILDNCLPFVFEDLSNAEADSILEHFKKYADCVVTSNNNTFDNLTDISEYNQMLIDKMFVVQWRNSAQYYYEMLCVYIID